MDFPWTLLLKTALILLAVSNCWGSSEVKFKIKVANGKASVMVDDESSGIDLQTLMVAVQERLNDKLSCSSTASTSQILSSATITTTEEAKTSEQYTTHVATNSNHKTTKDQSSTNVIFVQTGSTKQTTVAPKDDSGSTTKTKQSTIYSTPESTSPTRVDLTTSTKVSTVKATTMDTISSGGIKSNTTCEGEDANLTCEDNKVIKIISATYGRTQPYEMICPCPDMCENNYGECRANVTHELNSTCSGKSHCNVHVINNAFTPDPCKEVFKYLTVEYWCKRNMTGI